MSDMQELWTVGNALVVVEFDHLIEGLGFLEHGLKLEYLNVDHLNERHESNTACPPDRRRTTYVRGQEIEQGASVPSIHHGHTLNHSVYLLDEPRELPSHRVKDLELSS